MKLMEPKNSEDGASTLPHFPLLRICCDVSRMMAICECGFCSTSICGLKLWKEKIFSCGNISTWLIEEALLPAWPAAMKHSNHSTKHAPCFQTEKEKPQF